MSVCVNAQRISINAPSHVSAGEQFRLQYTIGTQNVNGFRIGNIPDALEVLMGPSTSSQSSFQMVNGHTNSTSSITYTYILCANKNGEYIISPAHAHINGKNIASAPVKIRVSGKTSSNYGGGQSNGNIQMKESGSRIKGSDLFIRVSANKKIIHEQEPVLLTYKVYTLVELTQLEGKMPDLTGFHTQEVQLPQQKSFHIENVNGKPYRCVTWSQYVMYPQITGKLTIPSITFKGIVVKENRNIDPFEAFFNGGSGYVEIKKDITAPSISIQVNPLPNKPANFSGGVGRFNISAQLNKKEIKANDPINIRVVVSGIGNLKLIKCPVVNFPKDFDKYDAKITDKTKLTMNGVEGNMIYDFLAVPRNQGKYNIPPISFTYYDTKLNAYRTIKTQAFNLNVEKGDANSGGMNDYSEQKKLDILPLKTGMTSTYKNGNFYYGSTSFWICLIIPFVLFIALLIIFRKRALEKADVTKLKGKKANKVALKRLRKANVLLTKGNTGDFYDEVLKALWGYVGDKLNMPIEQLSRENISDKLSNINIDDSVISMFLNALDECEFERFAPGDPTGNMNKTFESAMTAIIQIENGMKISKKNKLSNLSISLLFVLLFVPLCSYSVTKENADAEYSKGNYQQAIKDYNELLKSGISSDLYYNLGNAYYRSDNIPNAVLAYERAKLLSPGDADIRFNLQMAKSKTIDKITPESELFFITFYHSLINVLNVDGWAYLSVVSIILALLFILFYLFAKNTIINKISFYGGIILFLIFLLSNIFAYKQSQLLSNRIGAIVMSPSVTVKKTPSVNSADMFVIHEGTTLRIIDDSMKNWKCVHLDDGREGWIPTSNIEII